VGAGFERKLTPDNTNVLPVLPTTRKVTSTQLLTEVFAGRVTSYEARLVLASAATFVALNTGTDYSSAREAVARAVREEKPRHLLEEYSRAVKTRRGNKEDRDDF